MLKSLRPLLGLTAALVLASCDMTPTPESTYPTTPTADGKVKVIAEASLPATSLTAFGYTAEQVAKAKTNGLRTTDLPAIGSGLLMLPDGDFLGITDRGPNEDHLNAAGKADGKIFPMPEFSPTMIRFKADGSTIKPVSYTKMTDSQGNGITGLTNVTGEELPFESQASTTPLPFNVNGMDTEAIARFPDGRFIVVEETSPSIAILSDTGKVLVRYTPTSKPLTGAGYPVKNILPDVYTNRRVNRGFESVSLSGDGKTAWVTLQSPMGDPKADTYKNSRILRTLKLDVADPLNAKVTGEYLTLGSAIADYPAGGKQADLKVSDTAWIAGDKILTLERAGGLVQLLVDDFSNATNVLTHAEEGKLIFENTATDLSALGIKTSTRKLVFKSTDAGIVDDKLEGLAILTPATIALTNDNDFGIGDNKTNAPSKIWFVQLGQSLK
ncbi:esterase-like activity of phytase family protein [Deinococcus cavernae]|uniref:Esterase-like activity of phytase family protein n=1 Tax=Deinococcus cavernae TaxID=2320857 RepID=A0A418VHS8_9DEIO|nr:esterase-like activity of phytase family protein [Deinococcus cavernae]RJF75652.1 esterase-like activity of phytase family protein [Deinococcus cavernae]